jgi:H2-forming N5,N10-methylenetetrahydromethanopterin dehydrogenase-like enzyme
MKGFLQTVISTLQTVEDQTIRMEVYKILTELKDAFLKNTFLEEIDTIICKSLNQMMQKDVSFVCQTIAILTETTGEGRLYHLFATVFLDLFFDVIMEDLVGDDLKEPSADNSELIIIALKFCD